MWLTPRARGLTPKYGSMSASQEAEEPNVMKHLVSDVQSEVETPVKINTDANIFVATVTPQAFVELSIKSGRQAYMLCVEGGATVGLGSECTELSQHDAAEVHSAGMLRVEAGSSGVHVLVVEMAQDGAGGRTDL